MSLSHDFYELAIDDVKAANTLFQGEIYHLAVYNLQQSIEKLVKAYSLEGKIIPFEKFKNKIGHEPQKVFRKQAETYRGIVNANEKNIKQFPEFFDIGDFNKMDHTQHKKDVNKSVNQIQHLSPKDFLYVSESDLDRVIKKAESYLTLELDKEIDEKEIEILMKDIVVRYFDGIAKYDPIGVEKVKKIFLSKDGLAFFCKLTVYQFELIPKIVFLNYSLFVMSLLLSSHEATTRYPCSCGFSPQRFYKKGLPLVDKLEELLAWQEKSIRLFEEVFYTENEELKELGEKVNF